jgi:hypothetical protein
VMIGCDCYDGCDGT